MKYMDIEIGNRILSVSGWDSDKEVMISVTDDETQVIYLQRPDFEKLYSFIGQLMENAPKK